MVDSAPVPLGTCLPLRYEHGREMSVCVVPESHVLLTRVG